MRSKLRERWLLAAAALCAVAAQAQGTTPFSIADALSAPFCNHLAAAPARGRVAWFVYAEGARNVWVASAGEPARALTHNTADDGQEIDDFAWSPDAEQLAWTRGTGATGLEHPVANPAQLPGELHQNVELAELKSGTVRVVGEGHSPVFLNPAALLFVRHGDVWIVDPRDAAAKPRQLTFVRGRAEALRPSPDGTSFAFVSVRGDHSFVGVFTVATQSLTWMDADLELDHDPVWSADGKQIAFVREVPLATELRARWLRAGQPWSIRVADAATGAGRELWHAAMGPGSLFHSVDARDQLLWQADGSIVFPWERDGWLHLYAVRDGSPARLLTPGEFEVDTVAARAQEIVYSSNQHGQDESDADRRHLWSLRAGSTAPEQLTRGSGIETGAALLTDGTVIALAGNAQSPLLPARVANDGRPTALAPQLVPTRFPGAHFTTPQQVLFKADDGQLLHGQLFLPPKQTGRHPAVVFFHGGSRRQMLLGYNPMQYYAQTYAMNQYMASRGYVVLSVNYRSGTGYGLNFRQTPDNGANGGSEIHDVVGAAQYLRSRADVDPARSGAWGGSYGGYLTALALARRSDLYAAGVDLHGVHDWSLEFELSKPSDDPALDAAAFARTAFQSSPMASLDTWRSPVLLMHGDDDRNVLFAQTVRLAAELRARGVPVESHVFPDETHDFLLHRDWLTAYTLAAEFFDRRLAARQ